MNTNLFHILAPNKLTMDMCCVRWWHSHQHSNPTNKLRVVEQFQTVAELTKSCDKYLMVGYSMHYALWFLVGLHLLLAQSIPEHKQYNLVAVCTFKNESMVLESWLRHYISEGVEHFYIIDNGSQDDYLRILQHIPGDLITVVRDSSPPKMALQDHLMNKYFTSLIVADATWVMVVDVDEYVYPSDPNSCIADVLAGLPSDVTRVWLPWKVFGSNGHIKQPQSIIQGFTKRGPVHINLDKHALGYGKTIARVSNRLHLLTHSSTTGNNPVHYSNGTLVNLGDHVAKELITDESIRTHPLQLNHYMFQSREYYETVKCSRGGGQSGHIKKYTMEYFDTHEPHVNQIEDTQLLMRYEARKKVCSAQPPQ